LRAAEPRPLEGRTIVLTRAPEQARELREQLEALGADVLLLPAVSFSAPEDTAALDAAIRALDSFDWLVLTSQNAVRFFCRRSEALGVNAAAAQAKGLKIAAVGPATARAAEEFGLRADHVAARSQGAALAEELAPQVKGKRVLLPRSDRARAELPAALRAAGAEVVDVVAYVTRKPEAAEASVATRIVGGEADVVAFASPSAFEHFAEELGMDTLKQLAEHCALAAIGPVTAEAIRAAGLRVEIEAAESTSAGLVNAIVRHFTVNMPSGAAGR
jgi:uroporphyrinogen III methyltransferase/synthase